MAAQVAPTLTRWFRPGDLARSRPGVRYARERLQAADLARWTGAWRAIAAFDALDQLPGLTMPALCLSGSADASTPPAILDEIADRVPHATKVTLAGVPHLMSLTHPAAVAGAIRQFLRT